MADTSPNSREERLAAKLRENLRRRKAQARALGAGADESPVTRDGPNESGAPLSKQDPNR